MVVVRIDTQALKQQLADTLGDSGKEYWKTLSLFMKGRCSKETLDQVSLAIFTTPHQTKLLNKLITAILYNVSSEVSNPVGVDTEFVVKTHLKGIDALMALHLKKRFNSKTISSMDPEDRARLLQDNPISRPQLPSEEELIYPKGITGIPKTCFEDGDLPSNDSLRTRMKFISAFQGLEGFSSDAVLLLGRALDHYMKDTMSDIISKTSSQSRTVIELEDLLFSVDNSKFDS